MNKAILAVGAMLMLGGSMQVNADTKICVFDLLGKSGEAYKAMEEWALAAKTWRSDITLLGYQNQQILREARIGLTSRGIYDATMMNVLKRARCTVDRTSFECSLGGE